MRAWEEGLSACSGRFKFLWSETAGSGSGWWPSDIAGLYHILEAAREQIDPQPSASYLKREAHSGDSSTYATAMIICRHIAKRFPVERLEFVAKAFHHVHGVEIAGATYDTILVGTPIWVATPQPRAMEDAALPSDET